MNAQRGMSLVFAFASLGACADARARLVNPTASASANAEIIPGQRITNGRRVVPGQTSYVIYQLKGTSRVAMGLLSRDILVDTVAPRGRLTLIQRWEFPQGVQTDTSVVYLDTLEPITYRGSQQGDDFVVDFSRGRAQGTKVARDGTRSVIDVTAEPFFNEVIDEVFAEAQPLSMGFGYSYRAYNPGEPPRLLNVRVTGSEMIPAADGSSIETWVLEQRGVRDLVVTWWLDKRTRREIRSRVVSPDGSAYFAALLFASSLTARK